MKPIFFPVEKGQVIEHGEGHSSIAKRDGVAYFEGEELKMQPQPSLSIFVNRQILEEVIARGARGAGSYRLVRTSPNDIEFTVTPTEQTK